MSISPVISTSVANKVNTPVVSSSILIDTSYAIGGLFTGLIFIIPLTSLDNVFDTSIAW